MYYVFIKPTLHFLHVKYKMCIIVLAGIADNWLFSLNLQAEETGNFITVDSSTSVLVHIGLNILPVVIDDLFKPKEVQSKRENILCRKTYREVKGLTT